MNALGTLYIVATPIGNLEDMTFRAVRILREVDYILSEDTRVTGKLLKHYGVNTHARRYDAHASEKVHATIIDDLIQGKSIALVSDAGTPGVSDPGALLVGRAREASAPVVAVPGSSSLTAAVSIAGFVGNQFTFLGFVPQKKGRETFFKELAAYHHPRVFFESTHRIMKTLGQLGEHYPEAQVSLARELTKLHEELLVGTPMELHALLEREPVKQKGEFVVIVEL